MNLIRYLKVIVLLSVLFLPVTSIYAEFVVDSVKYSTISNTEASVVGFEDGVKNVVIRDNVEGYEVTSIGYRAFSNCSSLVSVTIPEGVTSIGDQAFSNCSSLSSISISNSVSYIGQYAFNSCSSLTSITIPDNVTIIQSGTFQAAGLVSITIPDSVVRIKNNAFSGCRKLSSIVIPEKVVTIEDRAFQNCKNLDTVVISGNTSIGSNVFIECTGITTVSFLGEENSIGESAFYGCSNLTFITFSGRISEFGKKAFQGCCSLVSITIPDGLTKIDDYVFYECSNLSSITIPDCVKTIGEYCFYGCSKLKSIDLPDSLTYLNTNSFCGCKELTSVCLPDGVTGIGISAFECCSSLSSIEIPNGVTSIGNRAFADCSSLTSFDLSEKVNFIGNSAFAGCSSLTSFVLSNEVYYIGNSAFAGCSSLTSMFIPDGVTELLSRTFSGCTGITSLSIPCTCTLSADNFSSNDLILITIRGDQMADYNSYSRYGKALFFVEDSLYSDYVSDSRWSDIYTRIVCSKMLNQTEVQITANPNRSSLFTVLGDSSIKVSNLKIRGSINGYDIMALRNKTIHLLYLDLSEADIVANDDGYEYYTGYSLKSDNSLGEFSFANTNLREVVLPKSLVSIEKDAFYNCKYLEKVIMSEGLEDIGSRAFYNCTYLGSITLPKTIVSINNNAFNNCTKLTNINFPDSLQIIGESAFQDCKKLFFPVLRIPDKVQVIGEYSFSGCSLIDTIVINNKLPIIEKRAFKGCGASMVVIGSNVKEISFEAFGSCPNLRTVVFNRNLLIIGESAFSGCNNLLEVSMPYSVENIGSNAFANCSSLKALKIPSMTKNIGSHAFWGCDSIENVYTYTVEPTNINQETFSCYRKAMLNVPKASADLYVYDTRWSQFLFVQEFDDSYDAFYLNGDLCLTESSGRLSGEPDAEMYSTSGIVVEGDECQELKDVELTHDGTNGGTIIGAADDMTGQQVNLTAQSLKVNISVDGNRWYFFCFPFDVERDSMECTTDYVFYSYNGSQRAGNNTGWVKLPDDFTTLQKGTGYIFQAYRTGILTIHVGSEYLTFKASNEKEMLNSYSAADDTDADWNFIGNPFISYYDVQDLAKEYDAPIVVWNGSGYDAYKPGDDNYQLKPFEAFFVQKDAGSTYVEFLPENRMTYNQAAAVSSLRAKKRTEMGTPITLDRQLVNIVLMSQDSISDRTRIVYSTKAVMDYEIGVDAAKFHTDGIPEIYTVNGTTRYAINERPMGTDDIKLGYIAPKAGTYTLSVPRHDAEIEIYDNDTHQTVDFTFGDYQFTSKAGTYNDRFVIHKTSGGVTAVDNGFRLDGITVTAFDGGIDIEGQFKGKVQIYSESGILMAEPRGAGRVQLDGGVYIIKIGDKSIKMINNS